MIKKGPQLDQKTLTNLNKSEKMVIEIQQSNILTYFHDTTQTERWVINSVLKVLKWQKWYYNFFAELLLSINEWQASGWMDDERLYWNTKAYIVCRS